MPLSLVRCKGVSALHIACERGDLALVRSLVSSVSPALGGAASATHRQGDCMDVEEREWSRLSRASRLVISSAAPPAPTAHGGNALSLKPHPPLAAPKNTQEEEGGGGGGTGDLPVYTGKLAMMMQVTEDDGYSLFHAAAAAMPQGEEREGGLGVLKELCACVLSSHGEGGVEGGQLQLQQLLLLKTITKGHTCLLTACLNANYEIAAELYVCAYAVVRECLRGVSACLWGE